jgi:hypothetical protein
MVITVAMWTGTSPVGRVIGQIGTEIEEVDRVFTECTPDV